jgi:hypothetical protein
MEAEATDLGVGGQPDTGGQAGEGAAGVVGLTGVPHQRRLARNSRSTLAARSWPTPSMPEPSVAAGTESSGSARAGVWRPPNPRLA